MSSSSPIARTRREKSLREFKDIFGPRTSTWRCTTTAWPSSTSASGSSVECAKEYDLKTVAANDVHFLNREDHEAHDVMICIGTGANVHDEKRMHYSPGGLSSRPRRRCATSSTRYQEACDAHAEDRRALQREDQARRHQHREVSAVRGARWQRRARTTCAAVRGGPHPPLRPRPRAE